MKITHQHPIPLRMKLFAWANIGVQSAFPLTLAFTPATAGAGIDRHIYETAKEQPSKTRIYVLSHGETSASVAKKFHITPEALRKLNLLRTFARGFDNVQPGDELDVPAVMQGGKAAPPAIIWDNDEPATSTSKEDAGSRKMADIASRTGDFLSNSPGGDAALSMARGQASAEASGQVQKWLNQFGTARVQLEADEHFSLKNSQIDLLIPFYERKDRLLFTQSSLHRTDDRTQANLGFGLRYFAPSYMLGGNIFGDYDLSRDHSRTGVGVEYWRDFLKLSANGYLRLSDWRDSPNMMDYQERPANGWDIRAQAWLPSLPQLGGKLTYEQYYGKGVALFGKENLQQNPHAVTAGVNFTPFPLLTLGAEHRQGASGKNDKRISADFSYRLGMPWQQQINPQAVATMRSLAGSRYDLVERNNHILLQYRKKEMVRLHTVDRVTGYAGEKKSLGVSVNSNYGLERIDWSASSLLASGGKLVREDAGNWSVILPEHKPGAQAVNTWTISGVAVDKKGNVSARADTQVTVTQAAIDASMSPVTPAKITLLADGKTQQQLVLKINDRDGKPVDIAESEISVLKESKLRAAGVTTMTEFSRSAVGEYIATLTAGTLPESFTIIPSARNIRFAPVSVELVANADSVVIKDPISVTPASAVVGTTVTYAAVLTDKQGNPQGAGIPVNWSANDGSTLNAQTTSSDETGTVVVTLTRMQPGTAKVSLTIPSGKYPAPDVVFSADVPDESRSELTLSPPVINAGKDRATLALILRDKNGNLLSGNSVRGQSDNSMVNISDGEEIPNNPGHYRMTVTAIKAGKATLSVKVDGKPFGNSKTLTITGASLTPDLSFAHAQQNVTWTKNFSGSQAVNGVPDGVEQKWSSADESVATVNEVGKVTLLKSGQTTITVKTSGNDQFIPGQASYLLKIDRADPQLQVRDGSPIATQWADGKVWSVTPTFGNTEANNSLEATYTSKNTEVVTVADNGELKAVKPGSTSITVSTPETAQFKAASVDVAYQLEKGTVDLSFKEDVITTTDEETFTLQLPEKPIPSDAVITWKSADVEVLNISSTGSLQGKARKGKTRLTLSVADNDYYHASSGYYDVRIYSKPSVVIDQVNYINKGSLANKGAWTPVFTVDNLSVSWATDNSNEFSKAKLISVSLKDSKGNVLAQKIVDHSSGSGKTTFEPKTSFWGTELHVELMAQGYGKLINTNESAGIRVNNLPPDQIWKRLSVKSRARIYSDNGVESTCREIAGPAGNEHWVNAIVDGGEIDFNGKVLISPMNFTGLMRGEQNGHARSGQFPNIHRNIVSTAPIKFGATQIGRECWKSHDGSYFVGAKVNYYGKDFEYWAAEPHNWFGSGSAINKPYVDIIK
ncbi:Putative AT-3 family protein [Erwinia amylovora Ea644]|uniref:inverse autotransporter beta domain-containing protein n=1 Tax=Erwinia amylovora TaxID=552 RepID=UPI0002C9DFB0|nr:inverse autotransporter beta-barrel domain-containing protein [Erwinia amylovora]CCP04595.1 Putative AT-3 family protein [Erwinia amylovora Ea644]CCP08659.1 Putative AT-3 family protein [Erwinia amylovora MR1]